MISYIILKGQEYHNFDSLPLLLFLILFIFRTEITQKLCFIFLGLGQRVFFNVVFFSFLMTFPTRHREAAGAICFEPAFLRAFKTASRRNCCPLRHLAQC